MPRKTKKEGDPSGGGGSDADPGSESPTAAAPAPLVPFSLVDLHAAMTATAPPFPAHAMRATAAAPSKGRASYVRRFCRVLRTSTPLLKISAAICLLDVCITQRCKFLTYTQRKIGNGNLQFTVQYAL